MDIERFKRLSIPKIEAGKMTEVVRDVIKGVQTSNQDVYEKTSEDLKPITEKCDEKKKKKNAPQVCNFLNSFVQDCI